MFSGSTKEPTPEAPLPDDSVEHVAVPTTSQNDNDLTPNQYPLPKQQQQQQQEQQHDQANGEEEVQQQEGEVSENAVWHWTKKIGWGIYGVLYAAGGFLSELFGITTPRYAYALREYERRQEQIRQRELEAIGETPENDGENPPPPNQAA